MSDNKVSPDLPAAVAAKQSYVEVQQPSHRLPLDVAAQPALARKVAVLVAHGMGNQVPFQTLEMVASRLLRHAVRPPAPAMPVRVGLANVNGTQLPRAEMTILDQTKRPVDVHFYEAYWAPLTEGKVTARDSVWFLFMAGLRGIWGAGLAGNFGRWMFEHWQAFPVHHFRLLVAFLAGMLVIASVVIMNSAIAAVAASRALTSAPSEWPSNGLLTDLTNDLAFFEIRAVVFLGVGLVLPMLLRWISLKRGRPFKLWQPLRWILRLSFAVTIVLTAWTGRNVVVHLVVHHADPGTEHSYWTQAWANSLGEWIASHTSGLPHRAADLIGLALRWCFGSISISEPGSEVFVSTFVLVWVVAVIIAYIGRWFLRQFVGDVAAYISSYAVSKFDELRNQIQEASLKVMRPVYEGRNASNTGFDYEEIVVVGHSLGSVIAYDTLNALLNQLSTGGYPLDVARRTKAFITFGSPLDKTAYIFRNQWPQNHEIREALAAAKQPMILDYANRPKHWVNIYSVDDWIGGSLEFYDVAPGRANWSARARGRLRLGPLRGVPAPAGGTQRIRNVEDPEACIPLAAHTSYWESETFAGELYGAIIA